MNKKDLFDSITDIDDKFVAESENFGKGNVRSIKRKKAKRVMTGLVACIVAVTVAVGGNYGLKQLSKSKKRNEILKQDTVQVSAGFKGFSDGKLDQMLDDYYDYTKSGFLNYGIVEESINDADTKGDSIDEASGSTNDNFTKTNTRDENVDEADNIKTNGEIIASIDDCENGNRDIINIFSVKKAEKLSTINLDEYYKNSFLCIEGIYLYNDILLAISDYDDYSDENDSSKVLVFSFDISDPKKPKLIDDVKVDGYTNTSRMVDGYLYLMTNYHFRKNTVKPYARPSVDEEKITDASIYCHNHTLSADSVYITSFKLSDNELKKVDNIDVISNCNVVYMTADKLYITGNNTTFCDYYSIENDMKTSVMSFSYKDGKITAGNQTEFTGRLLNDYSIDEYKGNLRAVVTRDNDNAIYIFDKSLKKISEITSIAKGEVVKSVRFLGDIAYVVTFENTDPLFTVDLSDAKNPEILDELKITGFSDYLHSVGENLMFGLGREVVPYTLEDIGIKISLFDTTDKTDVKVSDFKVFKDSYTNANYDRHSIIFSGDNKHFGFFAYTENYEGISYRAEHYFVNISIENGKLNCDKVDLSSLTKDKYGEFIDVEAVYVNDIIYMINEGEMYRFDAVSGKEIH